ncbi:MAG TPA: hypothetical protein VHC69_10000 [Polyangiaceae bacterium]|nr:hypothetical protein [Polyangiaceae bacterium]
MNFYSHAITQNPVAVSFSKIIARAQLTSRDVVCEGARSYAEIFRDLLVILSNRKCAPLNDPVGISGRIAAAATDAKRVQAARTVDEAARHADAALQAESAGNYREALRQWNIAFNNGFP